MDICRVRDPNPSALSLSRMPRHLLPSQVARALAGPSDRFLPGALLQGTQGSVIDIEGTRLNGHHLIIDWLCRSQCPPLVDRWLFGTLTDRQSLGVEPVDKHCAAFVMQALPDSRRLPNPQRAKQQTRNRHSSSGGEARPNTRRGGLRRLAIATLSADLAAAGLS